MEHRVNITFKTQILDKDKQNENFYKAYIFSQTSVMALSFFFVGKGLSGIKIL